MVCTKMAVNDRTEYVASFDAIFQPIVYTVASSAIVDGELWHTVNVSRTIAKWLSSNYKDKVYRHVDSPVWRYDMPDSLYLLLQIKYG